MSITIKQIAEIAGVHRSTVDKVLHNRPGVSDEVRQKIQALLKEHHYEANPIGKALQMQDKKLCIAVLLLQVDALPYLRRGMEETLQDYRAFQLQTKFFVCGAADVTEQQSQLQTCREQKVNGIVISPIRCPEIGAELELCQQAGIPVITVNTDTGPGQRLCFVGQNSFQSGQVAGRFMGEFSGGRGRIAVLTSFTDSGQSFSFGTREDGFRRAIQEHFPALQLLPGIDTCEDPEIMRRETLELLQREPELTGIFITCGCVPAACEALRESGRTGIRVICYESYPEILALLKEDLVTLTLASGLEQQGRDSMDILLNLLVYGRKPASGEVHSPIIPLVRESIS